MPFCETLSLHIHVHDAVYMNATSCFFFSFMAPVPAFPLFPQELIVI